MEQEQSQLEQLVGVVGRAIRKAVVESVYDNDNPLDYLLHDLGIIPGWDPSYRRVSDDLEDLSDDEDLFREVLHRRMVHFLRQRDDAGLLQIGGGYLIPTGENWEWRAALARYLKERYNIVLNTPDKPWRRYAFPAMEWEWVDPPRTKYAND